MTNSPKFDRRNSKLLLEELEERRLFSGGIEGLIPSGLDSDIDAIYADVSGTSASDSHDTLSAAGQSAEQMSQEIVFVDAGVDNYQQLIDDIRGNADSSRNIEVILLDRDENGIEQISSLLQDRSDLDALHIISHGGDGVVQLGNTALDANTLEQNNLSIALWANAFSESGDILIYGCDLASTESGQQLVRDLSGLTLTDVAASDNLTGHESLGGDWDLEYQSGAIDSEIAVTTELQDRWQQTLAVAVDNSSSGSTADQASVTVSHTTTGSNRLLLVGISMNPSGESVASVTYNGTSLVNIGSEESDDGKVRVEIWAMVAPDEGTHDVVVDFTGSGHKGASVGVMTYTGVNQTAPTMAFSSDSGSSAAAQTTVASAVDDLVFGVVAVEKGVSVAPGAGQTEHWDIEVRDVNGAGTTEAGAASVTTSWTNDDKVWSAAAVSIQADTNSAQVANLSAVQDSYIQAGDPTTNSGASGFMIIDRESTDLQRALVQFDLSAIPAGATIQSATLNLQATDVGGELTIEAYQLLESWSEGSTTWNERSSGSSWSTPGGAFNATALDSLVTNSTGRHSLDMTSLVQDWLSGAEQNYGVMIGSPDGGGNRTVTYDSREGSNAPYIEIIFTAPTAPVITSDGGGATADISVAENTTAVTTVTATDSELDTPLFSITGGADQGSFSIDPNSGLLTFDIAPDYENPADIGADNTYVVEVTASDGGGASDVQTITVAVTDVADGIRVIPTTVVPIGNETLVNTDTTDNQIIGANVSQALATDADGNYVIVWASSLQDSDGWGIYAQRFDADGTRQGGEIQINTTVASDQLNPTVAMDDLGNFVVAWQSDVQDGDSSGVYARQFNAAGVPQTGELLVNTTTADFQGSPGIAMAPNGDYAIIWTANGQDPDGSLGIYGQVFNANGSTRGGEFRVNTYTADMQQVSSISMADNGNFIVTWGSRNQDGSNYGVYGQMFDADGVAAGSEFRINTTTANSQLYNDVVMLPDGRFAVAYQSVNNDSSNELFIQRFNSDGSPLGGEINVNSTPDTGYFPIPSITADASGNLTVAWQNSNDGDGSGVFIRRYDWSGNALTGEIQVNTTTSGNQAFPDVVGQRGGGFIVTWGGNGVGDADGVFAQRYGLTTTEDGGTTSFQLVLEAAPTADVTIPISIPDGTEGSVSTTSVTFTAGNWNIPQTVTVTGLQDFILDGDQSYTVSIGPATSSDPNFNGLDPADLTILNIETNTPPVITSDGAGDTASISVAENTTAVTTVTASDVDLDTPVYSITGGADQGFFSIDGNSGVLTFTSAPDFEAPGDVGANNTYEVQVTASDGLGGTDTQTITVTVTNVSEAPVFGGAETGAVTEDVAVSGGFITDSGVLTVSDSDAGESSFQAETVNGSYGNLTIDTAGNWSYSADNSQAVIQTLDDGETLTDTLTVRSFDGTTHDIVITLTGTEDAAVIGGVATGAVAEDGAATASGTLTITDTDTSDNPVSFNDVAPTLGDNGYGDFELTGNTWTFTLNNGHAAVQALDAGETLNDTYTFTATDGSTQTVTITINGNEDAPVIGGVVTGTVAEDGTLTASDTLTITDTDTSDNPISYNDVAPTLGDNGYGNFEITGNTWTFTLNNSHAAVQALDAGETLNDTYTFTATDGSTQTVTITINGDEDAAVIGGTSTGTVAEDGTLTASDTLTITDADTSDNPVTFNDVAPTLGDNGYGNFEITGNTWTFTLDNSHAAVQALDAGESLTDTYTFTASDGSTQTVTITINGNEDAAVIGGVATGTVAEDGTLTASDTLTISDTDTSDNPVTFNDVAPTLGDNGYGNFEITGNTWTFTLDNSHAAVQALDAGETLNDTYTFTATDGSTQTVTITINGNEDAAVIGGVATGTVAEDGTLTASDSLTITDADASDNPVSFNDVAPTLGDNGYGHFEITGNTWTFTLDNANATIQGLSAGDSLTDTFTFTASDGSSQLVSITINGSEDAPILQNNLPLSVPEEGSRLITSANLAATDSDNSASEIVYTLTQLPGSGGAVQLNGSTLGLGGTFTQADINSNLVRFRFSDDAANTSFRFTLSDGTTTSPESTFSINGAPVNDAPINTVPGTQTVAEETPTAISGISITDIDANGSTVTTQLQVTAGRLNITLAGSASISAGGNDSADLTISGTVTDINATLSSLTYTGNADVTGVGADTLTVTTDDGGNTGSGGALQDVDTVQIDITDVNDPAVIGGTDTGSIQEDVAVVSDNLSAAGTLTITDPDAGESSFQAGSITGTYGALVIDTAGNWTYTADNTQAAIQQLDASESVTDTLVVTSADGTTHNVVITINGSEDTPVIGGVATGSVVEDGALTASDTLSITDTDTSDNPVSFNDVAPTLGDNGYGNFEITGNTWTFTLDNSHAAVQALDVGETLNDTYTFTATDGSTQTVTITINGNEDAAVIGGVATGTVAEDGALTASDTLTISDTDTSDNPVRFNDVAPTLGDNGYGNFEITGNTWTFTLDNSHAAVQALDVGETLNDTYTFTATDGSTQTVTITINGDEDTAVIGGTATGTVAEDGTLTASDTLTITDVDASDNPVSFNDVAPTLGDNGYGNFEITGNTWTFTLDNSQAAVQALDVGESLTDTYTFTATDGSTQTVTVTINGDEDAAVTGGTSTGSVSEDGTLTASDMLTITDVDASDNPVSFNDVAPTLGDNGYGNFEITGNTWTFTLDNSHAAVQALDAGESLTDSYTFTASDGSTQTVTITINGNEDAAVIGGVATGTVAEDGTLTASDTLTITDADGSDNPVSFNDVAPTLGDNGYGNFEITGNTWTFTLDNSHASVQALDVGETLNDTYTFTATDGSTQTVTITINGNEDTAVIGGVATGTVAEDGALTASDTLTISDTDTSDNPVSFNDVAPTLSDNGYGTFEITGNTWTFTLDNSHAAVQALDAGESLTDTYTFTATDGSTQTVTITINGNEDAAVIGGAATGTVAEDGALTASDTLTISDPDTSDNPVSFNDVAPTLGDNGYGNFEITGNTWTFTLDNSHAAVQALDVGETLNDTYTFTATDGSTQTVTITINGDEDAAVIGGVATGTVAEDGPLTASDTLTIADADASDNPVTFNDVAPTLGDYGYGNFEITGNTWTYTLDNSHAAVQALDAGETLNDTFTFTATDGSTQTVTITISGNEDAPVNGGVVTGSVTEDAEVSAGQISDTGTANITVSNPGESIFEAGTVRSAYGEVTIDADGYWRYSADNDQLAIQSLDAGETLIDSLSVTALDGTVQTVVISIRGAEDAPVISGVMDAVVNEVNARTASGTLLITDVDTSDTAPVFDDVAPTLGDNGFGTFQFSSNTWTYELSDSGPMIQGLDAGAVRFDTFTFVAPNGVAQKVTVTIVGGAIGPLVAEAVTVNTSTSPLPSPASDSAVEAAQPVAAQTTMTEASEEPDRLASSTLEPDADLSSAVPLQLAFEAGDIVIQRPQDEAAARQESSRAPIAAPSQATPAPTNTELQIPQGQDDGLEEIAFQVSDDEEVNARYEQALLDRIDRMQQSIDGDSDAEGGNDVEVRIIMGSTAGITAGVVSWVLRGGSLIASLMGSVPLLSRFDPLPILKSREDDEDDETPGETPDTEEHHARRVETLFAEKTTQGSASGHIDD